jgi:hypothetical protein
VKRRRRHPQPDEDIDVDEAEDSDGELPSVDDFRAEVVAKVKEGVREGKSWKALLDVEPRQVRSNVLLCEFA